MEEAGSGVGTDYSQELEAESHLRSVQCCTFPALEGAGVLGIALRLALKVA